MARRPLLTAFERAQLLAVPEDPESLARVCVVDEADMSLIRQRRGDANRLGFAVQLCLLNRIGVAFGPDTQVPDAMIARLAADLGLSPGAWADYGSREETRQEHAREIRAYLGLSAFGIGGFRSLVEEIEDVAAQTDRGVVLVERAIESLRQKKIALPALEVIENACAQALTRANRRVYAALGSALDAGHRSRLDGLLRRRPEGSLTLIGWLRQAPARPNARSMLEHIERLNAWRALALPWASARLVHRNRLVKLAREGGAPLTGVSLAAITRVGCSASWALVVAEHAHDGGG